MSKREARRQARLEMVERWRKSGLSPTDFAKQEGVTRETLRRWAMRADGKDSAKSRRKTRSAFIPIAVASPAAPLDGALAEIRFANGRSLLVRPGFEASELQLLIQIVEAC